jgi:hypothetical protein
MTTIREQVTNNPLFQSALEAAPEEERARIEAYNGQFLDIFEELASNIHNVVNDPALREQLKKELRQKGLTDGL